MSEEKPNYKTETDEALAMLGLGYEESQPAVVVSAPRTSIALHDDGLEEYKVWGWVKKSAKFLFHVKRLKGAKLAIFDVIILTINEEGESKLSLSDLVKLSGYSRSEVVESVKEMQEMGYLSVRKLGGKNNVYKPLFAARGDASPETGLVQKLDRSSLQERDQSSPAIENTPSSIKELKEFSEDSKHTSYRRNGQGSADPLGAYLNMGMFPGAKKEARIDAILSYLGQSLKRNTETKEWRDFAKYIDGQQQTTGQRVEVFVSWLLGQKNYDPTYWPVKKMREFWPAAFVKERVPQDRVHAL